MSVRPRYIVVVSHPYQYKKAYWTFLGAWHHAQQKPRNASVVIIDSRNGDVLWACHKTCSHSSPGG